MNSQGKLIVEFIGTFFLVLTVGLASASGSALAPLAIGFSLMVMIFAGGHISGGHFNPAVSLAAKTRGALDSADLPAYWVAQVLGAIVAGVVVIVLGADPDTAFSPDSVGKALLAEFLFTFALCWVVLQTATAKGTEGNSFYGLAIGSTVIVGAIAVGAISGGAFNPAVAIGAIVMGAFEFSDIWIYLVANLAAALVAAAAFKATVSDEA